MFDSDFRIYERPPSYDVTEDGRFVTTRSDNAPSIPKVSPPGREHGANHPADEPGLEPVSLEGRLVWADSRAAPRGLPPASRSLGAGGRFWAGRPRGPALVVHPVRRLQEVVPPPHPQDRAHPREAVEHHREKRPVAQACESAGIDVIAAYFTEASADVRPGGRRFDGADDP